MRSLKVDDSPLDHLKLRDLTGDYTLVSCAHYRYYLTSSSY